MKDLVVSSFKLKALSTVFTQTINDTQFLCSTDDKSLNVFGTVVKMSDALSARCWKNAQYIEIFAFSKKFIDQDIVTMWYL